MQAYSEANYTSQCAVIEIDRNLNFDIFNSIGTKITRKRIKT